jgi:cytochrome c biogenesis protein CcmG/thiol:disulfide interchange protein DsbE
MQMSKQLQVPLIGMDYKDTDNDASEILQQAGNPYQTVVTDSDGRVGIDYGVYGVPETYLIDKNGVIRYKQIGPITEEALRMKIMPLINVLQ